MRKKTGLFIGIGGLIILLLLGYMYIDYMMDRVIKAINRPGVVFNDPGSPQGTEGNGYIAKISEGEAYTPGEIPLYPKPADRDKRPGDSEADLPSHQALPNQETLNKDDIIAGAQEKLGRSIDKKDFVKAGIILLKRLDWSEIEYLYRTGSKEQMNDKDLIKIHRVLRQKLTVDEIEVMQDLARKYGKNLDFLSAETL